MGTSIRQKFKDYLIYIVLIINVIILVTIIVLISRFQNVNENINIEDVINQYVENTEKVAASNGQANVLKSFEEWINEYAQIDSLTFNSDRIKEREENLKEIEKQIRSMENQKKIVDNLLSSNSLSPYVTLRNIGEEGQNLTISKAEMRLLLRYVFLGRERMMQDRFEVIFEDLNNNKMKTTFLIDKSLGNVWRLNKDCTNFSQINIPNLVQERKNSEADYLIDLFLKNTGGYDIDWSKDKSTKKDSLELNIKVR